VIILAIWRRSDFGGQFQGFYMAQKRAELRNIYGILVKIFRKTKTKILLNNNMKGGKIAETNCFLNKNRRLKNRFHDSPGPKKLTINF